MTEQDILIQEGMNLLYSGMTVVFTFLVLLIISVNLLRIFFSSAKEHALDSNIHVKHKTYKTPHFNRNSPPKPPPLPRNGFPPKIKRAQSSPSSITFLPMPEEEARPKTPAPDPPPLPPGSAKETKEEKADKLKF